MIYNVMCGTCFVRWRGTVWLRWGSIPLTTCISVCHLLKSLAGASSRVISNGSTWVGHLIRAPRQRLLVREVVASGVGVQLIMSVDGCDEISFSASVK